MKIKWGILGAGWIADKFVDDFKLVGNGEVIAVAARDLARAKTFGEKFNIRKVYGNYNDLIHDSEVDIIYIATTHNFHFEHSKNCLENGKAVLCEKPATVNAKQFQELCRIANANKLFYMEAMWTPFLPAIKQAQKWIEQGEIGKVEVVQANFGFHADPETSDRLFNPNLAGGALLDIGIYPLTIIEMFAKSEIDQININANLTTSGVDETLSIQIQYKNGVMGQMATSIKNPLLNNAIICGSKGFIQIPDFWMSKKAILNTGGKQKEFIDKSETMGYNFETVAVNNDLINSKIENDIMTQTRTYNMMQLMDSIRIKIGLHYPFE